MVESFFNERQKFWQDVEIIQNTEGFPYLTRNQQRMIILSLYLEDRSERDSAIGSISELYVDRSYCHESIHILETDQLQWPQPLNDLPSDFFNTIYVPITNKNEAVNLINYFGFPCVVHIHRQLRNTGQAKPFHTCLALGHDSVGEIVIWEKEGLNYPFRITNIEAQLKRYGAFMYWGVRKLRTKP